MTPPYAMPKTTAAAKKLQPSPVKRYEKTIAAWRARPATRVRLAPKRSARRPEPIRPAIDESPETPRTVAATMGMTPWLIACVTMWKIGPECAAQQAKCVSAIAQNCGAWSTWPGEKSRWRAAAAPIAAQRDTAAAEPVRERAPKEGAEPHRDPVRQRDQRDGAPAPAHRVLERLQEDAEREEGPLADRDDRGGGREDDPAVEESALTHGRELR